MIPLPPRAYLFISLNVVRVLSMIALILVFASNIMVMVDDIKAVRNGSKAFVTTTGDDGQQETFECDYFEDSTVPNQAAGAFWAVLNRLFIIFTSILLFLSELGWPERFFVQFLPILGPDFGVGILGGIQWVTAASILSHHVDVFPLVSAWFLFALGCINIILGLAFRSGLKIDRSLTTFREAKARELLPGPLGQAAPHFKILETSASSIFGSVDEKRSVSPKSPEGSTKSSTRYQAFGFGRQGEKYAAANANMNRTVSNMRLQIYPPSSHSEAPGNINADQRERERERESHHGRLHGAISSSINSLAEILKDPSKDGRSVKFPDKLFKVLDQKMQNITMGKDPQYTDQYTRRVIGAFWSSSIKVSERPSSRDGAASSSWRQIRENRKIEELILFFVTTATQTLRKDPTITGDAWKVELNTQISVFVQILRECLRGVSHVPPEITSRLEMYSAKLADGTDSQRAASSRSSVYGTPSPSLESGPSSATGNTLEDMELVKSTGQLFGRSDTDLQRDVNASKRLCTEKAALLDLKTCLKNINADMPFPGRRDDFDTAEAFTYWRTQETAHLQQLVLAMIQFNPELRKSIPSSDTSSSYVALQRPVSMFGSSSANGGPYEASLDSIVESTVDSDDDIEIGGEFTYIPPNPRKYYKRLLEICVQFDLEAMVHLPEDQEVSLTIISPKHLDLLNQCAIRWRITHAYRVTCFIDVIRYKYERDEVPIECIPEALGHVAKAIHDVSLDKWSRFDVDYVSTVYGSLFNVFLGALYEALEDITRLKAELLKPYVDILDTLRSSSLVERYKADIDGRLNDLADRVRIQAVHQYTDKNYELTSKPEANRALPLLYLTDYLEKQAKLLDKRFPEPILGQLDLVSLALDSWIPLFLTDLDNARLPLLEAARAKPPDVPLTDIFALFRRTKTLLSMHAAFCPQSPMDYDISGYFEPYILQWLLNTDLQTAQWVNTAISVDKFEAEGVEGHSSSIIDLFDNLKSPIDFLFELKWPEKYQEARFFTGLSKTISKLVEEYCRRIEDLFMEEMFPRTIQEAQPQKQYAFIEKAKLSISREKKVEPFNFTPSSCVKLNNIEAARSLLDSLYVRIDVDKISKILEEHGPPVPEKVDRQRFLFTVKVVQAEGLVPSDASPSTKLDTFVTLSDEKGIRLAKTRTIYETLNPRWDETFDISVDNSLWVMASVRDRAIIGKHDIVGRGYLCLDPRRFGDYLAHDLWLDLDPTGRILIRVSMEGEKDDAQFYFGRAFRSLKRAEADMIRVIVDKMAPLIRQYVNRSILMALIKSTTVGYDYNKALAGVTGLYRSAIGADKADSVIPPAPKDKPRIKPEALTDEETEGAIAPLFDYFDANFQILNSYLSPNTKETTMVKVWKEILATIEDLLVPPLSAAPSDMDPLSDKEVDVVFKWLKFLKDYTYAGGESPVALEQLQNQRYRDILSIRLYYDWSTDDLMEECVRLMQQNLREAPTVKKRAKTVYSQRNLGTIKERKKEKKRDTQQGNAEMILRILRMRPGTSDFISQQLEMVASTQAEQEKRAAARRSRLGSRLGNSPSPRPPETT
ncbi:hypothetical protein FRB99_000057 [Tulasnella sp. 403]|nr:hypothetical protein FRB99_000057 [Tulasnella sp. 403]